MSLKNKTILITSGPTFVPIDDMRIISNLSTGEMGRTIAVELKKARANITMIEGPIAFNELDKQLKNELKKNFDVVIHAAAVSDYQLPRPFKTKVSSNQKALKLKLVRTPKLINGIKKQNPKVILVGFKLESTITKQSAALKAKKLIRESGCDVVVVNSLSHGYSGFIFVKQTLYSPAKSRREVAKNLVKILKDSFT